MGAVDNIAPRFTAGFPVQLGVAVVTAVSPLTISMDTLNSVPANRLAGYAPLVGDLVAVLLQGTDVLVLGPVGTGGVPLGRGPIVGTALGVDRVDIGILAGLPTAIFEDAGGTLWLVDNNAGLLRFRTLAGVQLSLGPGGDLIVQGSVSAPNYQSKASDGPYIALNGTSTGGTVDIINRTTPGSAILRILAMAGQTGNLQEWYNAAAALVAKVDKDGNIKALSIGAAYYQSADFTGPYVSAGASGGNGTVDINNRNNVANTPLRVLGMSGQTGDALQVYADGAALGFRVSSLGTAICNKGLQAGGPVNGNTGYGHVHAEGGTTDSVKMIVDSPVGQSVDLQRWQKNAVVLARIDKDGRSICREDYATAYQSNLQQTLLSGTETLVIFDQYSLVGVTHDAYDPGNSNPTGVYFTIQNAGWYDMSARFKFKYLNMNSATNNFRYYGHLFLNRGLAGERILDDDHPPHAVQAGNTLTGILEEYTLRMSKPTYLVVGDVICVIAEQETGGTCQILGTTPSGTVNRQTWIEIHQRQSTA